MTTLRIFHTSDWHLGKPLKDVDRTADYAAFLKWLLDEVDARRPDVLLVAGDIFDTSMPSTEAQRLYYDFLRRAADTPIRAVVITAGNHDSQRFLSAPAPLLETLRCHIVSTDPQSQVVLLKDAAGSPILAVAAVPYLREGDVRAGEVGQAEAERAADWQRGVAARYAQVRRLLDGMLRAEGLSRADVPMVAMGHLFVAGSELRPGVGAEESVCVGQMRNVPPSVFGEDWDYVALGHIHNPQRVKRAAVPMYYSGSPLALNFKHRGYAHQILQIDIDAARPLGERAAVTVVPVPQPRFVGQAAGTAEMLPAIFRQIAETEGGPGKEAPLVEACVSGEVSDARALDESLRWAALEAGVVLCAVRAQASLLEDEAQEALRRIEDVTPEEVFAEIVERERVSLRRTLADERRRLLREEQEASLLAAWEAQRQRQAAEAAAEAPFAGSPEASDAPAAAADAEAPKLTSDMLAGINQEADAWAEAEAEKRMAALYPLFAEAKDEALKTLEAQRAAKAALLENGESNAWAPARTDDAPEPAA